MSIRIRIRSRNRNRNNKIKKIINQRYNKMRLVLLILLFRRDNRNSNRPDSLI